MRAVSTPLVRNGRHRPATVLFALLFLGSLFAEGQSAFAQGRSGALRLGIASTQEQATAGTLNPFSVAAADATLRPNLLAGLPSASASLGGSIRQYPFGAFSADLAVPLGDGIGVGAGLRFDGVSNIDFRDPSGSDVGEGAAGRLVVSAGAGLDIGPASIGGSLRLLYSQISDVDADRLGLAVDLSAGIGFADRLALALQINNVAAADRSESTAATIPADIRLAAAWRQPLESRSVTVRTGPIGIPVSEAVTPPRYISLLTEVRVAEFDDGLLLGLGFEAVPVAIGADLPIGFRAGLNSRGEIGGGLFLGIPQLGAPGTTLAFSALHSPNLSGNAFTIGLNIVP